MSGGSQAGPAWSGPRNNCTRQPWPPQLPQLPHHSPRYTHRDPAIPTSTTISAGNCLMFLSATATFKNSAGIRRRGGPGVAGLKLGSARFPGSEVVYDREKRQLVACRPGLCGDSVTRPRSLAAAGVVALSALLPSSARSAAAALSAAVSRGSSGAGGASRGTSSAPPPPAQLLTPPSPSSARPPATNSTANTTGNASDASSAPLSLPAGIPVFQNSTAAAAPPQASAGQGPAQGTSQGSSDGDEVLVSYSWASYCECLLPWA